MKLKVAIAVIFLFLSAFLVAEQAAKNEKKPVLEAGDVMKFIKTFPLLKKDFEKYGAKYDAKAGNITVPEAMKASSEYQAILKKHGWSDFFYNKFHTIVMGYASIVYGKEMKNADPKIQEALKKIEENPHLSDAMKEQMRKSVAMAQGALANQKEMMKNWVHQKDLALIKPHVDELKAVMEKTK